MRHDLWELVQQQFPGLAGHDVSIVEGSGPGFAEVYLKGTEDQSPDPARDVIELRDKSLGLTPEQKANIIAGEFISHILPERDQAFAAMRNQFMMSMTSQQLQREKWVMEQYKQRGWIPEDMPFQDYFNRVGLPGLMRGALTPEFNEESAEALRRENEEVIQTMRNYLMRSR